MKHLFFKLQSFLVLLVFTAVSAYAQKSSVDMNRFIDDLMKKMTLEEKIGQLNLPVTGEITTGQAKSSNVAKRIRAGEVGERKQCGCDAEAYAYDAKSLAEKSFYEILEKQSYDSYRDAAYKNFEHVVEIVVATECKERHAERFELMPQHDYGAEHSGYMEHHVELETFRS